MKGKIAARSPTVPRSTFITAALRASTAAKVNHRSCVHLAPEARLPATPENPQAWKRPPHESFHRVEQPPRVEGDALQDGATQMLAPARERHVEKGAAQRPVLDRAPLTLEPGREHHAARPDRGPCGVRAHLLVRAGSGNRVLEPFQAQPRGLVVVRDEISAGA